MKIADFSLERYFDKYEFHVKYLLCSSDPERLSIADVLALKEGAQAEFLNLHLGYTESRGSPLFRQRVAALYSNNIHPQHVLAFSGAEEPIFTLMNVLLDAGDHVIVHTPSYQSQFEVARAIGCSLSFLPAREELNWHADLSELEKLLTPKTKLLLINTPHNPTGMAMSIEELNVCVAFARKHNLWLVCDEVYRGLELSVPRLPGGCELYEKGISVGGMAKAYGLAGLRIGWLASQHAEFLNRCSAFKDYLTICNAGPSEYLATLALEHAQTLATRSVNQVKKNVTLFDSFVQRNPTVFQWIKPQGSTMSFVRYLPGNASEFCEKLVQETGVLLLPATLFDFGNEHVRLGLGRANFLEALQVLESWLTA
jgi:aspartate/methionine/tyrosine aminotransferase